MASVKGVEILKILIVSTNYPPSVSATAGILGNLVNEFEKAGCRVDVLTLKGHLKQPSVVYNKNSTIYYADYATYDKKYKTSIRDITFKAKRKIRLRFKTLQKIYDRSMVRAFLKAMKNIDMQSYDAIISVCAYYGSAEAVVRYKEKYGLHGKTFLYQVDPIVDNVAYQKYKKEEREAFARRLFDNNELIFTTNIIYDSYKGKELQKKMVPLEFPYVTLNPCYDADKKDNKEIMFLFTGCLYADIRSPKYLLDLFKSLDIPEAKLYIIGSGMKEMLDSYQEGELKDKIIRLGPQSPEVCEEWYAKADVLVNISNAVHNQVPSKIFKYISYGKPILNVYKLENSPCLKYLGDYPLAVNVFEGNTLTDNFVTEVKDKLQNVIGKRIQSEKIIEQFKECTPEYVADKMLECINGYN